MKFKRSKRLSMEKSSYQGKNYVIIGASSGIGKCCAEELSKLGANVILVARNQEKLDAVLDSLERGNHKSYKFDITKISGINDLILRINSDYSSMIDGLVYCPCSTKKTRFRDLTNDIIDSVMKVNFYGLVELVRCISKQKNKDSTCSVVAMSSLASIENTKQFLPYSSSKAALESSIRVLANELRNKKIYISGIRPGYVDTPLISSRKEVYDDFNEFLKSSYQPNGLIPPKVVADAVINLLGENSSYYSGSIVNIPSGVNVI